MKRIEAVKIVMGRVSDELVVCSCGMVSREVYSVCDRCLNFYVLGSMGSAVGIGIGLALNTFKQVIVVCGDGELLMDLGVLVMVNKLRLPNLHIIVLDNNCYQSTGCQQSCSDAVDFTKLCDCEVFKVDCDSKVVPRIPLSPKQIVRRFMDGISCLQ